MFGFKSADWSTLFAKLTSIKKLTIDRGIDTLECFAAGPITQALEELTLGYLKLPPSEILLLYGLRHLRTLDLQWHSFDPCLNDTTIALLSPHSPHSSADVLVLRVGLAPLRRATGSIVRVDATATDTVTRFASLSGGVCATLLFSSSSSFICSVVSLHSSSSSSHDERTNHCHVSTRISRIACSKCINRVRRLCIVRCLSSKLSSLTPPDLACRLVSFSPSCPPARRCCLILPIRDPTAFRPSTASLPHSPLCCVPLASIHTLAS